MKVLMITSGLGCGIEYYTKNLVSSMEKNFVEVKIVHVKKNFFKLDVLNSIFKEKPEIVHIQHEILMFDGIFGATAAFIYIYAFLLKKKIVTTFHTVKSLKNLKNEVAKKYRKNLLIFLARIYLKDYFKFIAFFSKKVVVLSEPAHIVLKKDFNIDNVFISHGFFLPSSDAFDKKNKLKDFQSRLGLKDFEKKILLFGLIYEEKGYHHVIKVLPLIVKRYPNIKLLISGGIAKVDEKQSRNYIAELKRLVTELKLNDNVKFTGYVPDIDIPYLLTLSDIVIFPYEERQSASGSISMVYPYKIPMVVSDIKAFEFLENGRDCIKVHIKDEKKLVEAIILLLENHELRNKLQKTMDERFKIMSIEKAAKEHIHIYGQIINRQGL